MAFQRKRGRVILRQLLVIPLAPHRLAQKDHAPFRVGHDSVFHRMAFLLAAVVALLPFGILGTPNLAFRAILPVDKLRTARLHLCQGGPRAQGQREQLRRAKLLGFGWPPRARAAPFHV